jgi:hypothetical protein
MAVHELLERDANGIGAGGDGAIRNERIYAGKKLLVDSRDELCHAFSVAICNTFGHPGRMAGASTCVNSLFRSRPQSLPHQCAANVPEYANVPPSERCFVTLSLPCQMPCFVGSTFVNVIEAPGWIA